MDENLDIKFLIRVQYFLLGVPYKEKLKCVLYQSERLHKSFLELLTSYQLPYVSSPPDKILAIALAENELIMQRLRDV